MAIQIRESMLCSGDHVVQFYDHDDDLARSVGDYLAPAVIAGDVAIVIATGAHRRAFEAELEQAGVDVTGARREGTLILLDAAATMARFMPDGRIDPDAFREVIGGLIGDAARGGAEIRAYGEMVALLWGRGEVVSAIELEKLWNELGRELHFALFCAYRSEAVTGHEHADALREVCRLHSAVVPSSGNVAAPPADERTEWFEATFEAPAAARRFAIDVLGRSPYADRAVCEDARLLVSELATNAVIHARTAFSVSVRCQPSAIRIAVRDGSQAPPTLRAARPDQPSGRGLGLVAAVAVDWGVEPAPDGKAVWAQLTA